MHLLKAFKDAKKNLKYNWYLTLLVSFSRDTKQFYNVLEMVFILHCAKVQKHEQGKLVLQLFGLIWTLLGKINGSSRNCLKIDMKIYYFNFLR